MANLVAAVDFRRGRAIVKTRPVGCDKHPDGPNHKSRRLKTKEAKVWLRY